MQRKENHLKNNDLNSLKCIVVQFGSVRYQHTMMWSLFNNTMNFIRCANANLNRKWVGVWWWVVTRCDWWRFNATVDSNQCFLRKQKPGNELANAIVHHYYKWNHQFKIQLHSWLHPIDYHLAFRLSYFGSATISGSDASIFTACLLIGNTVFLTLNRAFSGYYLLELKYSCMCLFTCLITSMNHEIVS